MLSIPEGLEELEVRLAKLEETLNDPLALIRRLWELEVDRRAPTQEPLEVVDTVSRLPEIN